MFRKQIKIHVENVTENKLLPINTKQRQVTGADNGADKGTKVYTKGL